MSNPTETVEGIVVDDTETTPGEAQPVQGEPGESVPGTDEPETVSEPGEPQSEPGEPQSEPQEGEDVVQDFQPKNGRKRGPRKPRALKPKTDEPVEGEVLPAQANTPAEVSDLTVEPENVEAVEGEVLPAQANTPAEVSDLTVEEARDLTDQLRIDLASSVDLMIRAFDQRIWIPLGYQDWAEYLDGEFGEMRPKYPVDRRQEMVLRMLTRKMSTRVIGSALGVTQMTIVNDKKALADRGLIAIESGKVKGEDGKEYGAGHSTGGRKPKRLEDRFESALTKADNAVGDLLEMSAEFDDDNLPDVRSFRSGIAAVVGMLETVLERLDGDEEDVTVLTEDDPVEDDPVEDDPVEDDPEPVVAAQ
jgi:hypothetical protein